MKLVVVSRLRDELEILPWFLANLTHADEIYLCDGGSEDGTWEAMQEYENKDVRIHASQWPECVQPFIRQEDHMDFAFSQIGCYDWLQYLDVDEICNITFQRGVRQWLRPLADKTAVYTQFLYVAAGWRRYYTEPSHPHIRMWNYTPRFIDEHGAFGIPIAPPTRLETPGDFMILHINWALEKRLERKLPLYEQATKTRRWYPQEKYTQVEDLPLQAECHTPWGEVMQLSSMAEWFL